MGTLPYYCIVFFQEIFYCGDVPVLQARNQKKTMYTLSLSSLSYSLANESEGRNKQSFEEGSLVHLVLVLSSLRTKLSVTK